MAVYIEKQVAIDKLCHVDEYNSRSVAAIKEMKPVDVHQTVYGTWIKIDDADNRIAGRCSACGWEAHLYEDDVVGMNYCPNCGAYMKGGNNG